MAPLNPTHLLLICQSMWNPSCIWLVNTRVFVQDQIICSGFNAKGHSAFYSTVICASSLSSFLTASMFSVVAAVAGQLVWVSFSRPFKFIVQSEHCCSRWGLITSWKYQNHQNFHEICSMFTPSCSQYKSECSNCALEASFQPMERPYGHTLPKLFGWKVYGVWLWNFAEKLMCLCCVHA